jgi:Xaa-Pro dipeptidase
MNRRTFSSGILSLVACAARRPAGVPVVPSRCPGAPQPCVAASARPPVPADDRFAPLRGMCSDLAPPDAAEWDAHLHALQRRMRELDVAALVCEPGANTTRLSGVSWGRSERPFLLVVSAEGERAWVCPAFEERTAREQLAGARLLPWREHEDPYARVAEALGSARRGRVALDPTMRKFVADGLAARLGSRRLVAGGPLLESGRMRKTARELAWLRRANEATKAALALAAAHVRAGTVQSAVAALVREALVATGLTDPWVLALVGPNASFPHGTREDREVAGGDVVLVDTGASLFGYRSDITRTFVVGEPTSRVRAVYDAVRRAQTESRATIRPGIACGDVDAAARAVVDAAGFGPEDRHFTHRLGHGIGLEVHEPPYLVRGSDLRLEPGMTMSDEPGIYLPGELGVRLEDIVAVTDDGHELFGPPPGPIEDPFAGHERRSP